MDNLLLRLNYDSLLLWGLLANIVLTSIMYGGQGLGFSRISLPFMLGTVFTANRNRAEVVGFFLHFLLGWIFGFVYALAFESIGRAGWWIGMIMGFVHGFFMFSAVIPLLPHIHPRMSSEHAGPTPTRMLEPPGFMALNYGRHTPLVAIIAHIAFGLILGAFYHTGG